MTLAEQVRLTTTAKAAGCAAKLSPSVLDAVLKRLPPQIDTNVIVGFETSDDAAVYRLTNDLAIVQTVDFFTPILDDPELFGQVAATNALSDVYAMGGRPISALTILAFPAGGAPEVLEQILRGGLAKMAEASCTVVGGHSIRDDELKFGYAVTGAFHEIDAAHPSEQRPIHAVTDVTGFALLGHAREMAIGSAVSMTLDHARMEYLPGAIEAAQRGFFSGGMKNNRDFVESCTAFATSVPEEFRALLFDPQTSGGLLAAIAPQSADAALAALQRRNVRSRRGRHVSRC